MCGGGGGGGGGEVVGSVVRGQRCLTRFMTYIVIQ